MTPAEVEWIDSLYRGLPADAQVRRFCAALRDAWAEIAHLEQTLEAMQRGDR